VRREANLLIGVYCNEVLGDDSPYKDDLAIKLFGKYASYENWLAAVAALEPPQPRKRKRKSKSGVAVPAAQSWGVPPHDHRSASRRPDAGKMPTPPAPAAVPRTNERPSLVERVPANETAAAGKMPTAGADETSALRAGGGTPPVRTGETPVSQHAGKMPTPRADEFIRVRERPEPQPTNIQEPRRGGTNGTGESPRAGEDARVPTQGSGGSPVPDA
jgi:hypothetical protein